jgi:hypothetical protein
MLSCFPVSSDQEYDQADLINRGQFFSQIPSWAVPDPEPCPVVLIKVKVHPCLDLNFAGSRQKNRPLDEQSIFRPLGFRLVVSRVRLFPDSGKSESFGPSWKDSTRVRTRIRPLEYEIGKGKTHNKINPLKVLKNDKFGLDSQFLLRQKYYFSWKTSLQKTLSPWLKQELLY